MKFAQNIGVFNFDTIIFKYFIFVLLYNIFHFVPYIIID